MWEHFHHIADVGVRGVGATMSEAFAEGARALAERVLVAVRELRFAGEGRNLTVTVSVGAAEMRRGSMFFDSLLNEAQEACKAAQKAGGDRWVARGSDLARPPD